MGATRNTALNELNFRGISINPTAGSNTISIVPSDSGIVFINRSTQTTNTNYVLPPIVGDGDGKMWWFLNATTSQGFVITAPAGTMVGNNSVTKTTATTGANYGGPACMVVGDGSKYYLFEMSSLAFTVA